MVDPTTYVAHQFSGENFTLFEVGINEACLHIPIELSGWALHELRLLIDNNIDRNNPVKYFDLNIKRIKH
jgi:hypothetical protein